MTGTIPQPPPEREVSSARRNMMHDQVRRRIAADRRRPTWGPFSAGLRRHLLPLAAAAAVLVVLGATVTVLTLVRRETPAPPAGRRVPSASPSPTPSRQVTEDHQNFTALRTPLRDACAAALENEKPGPTSRQTPMAKTFVDLDALRFLTAATINEKTAAAFTDGETLVFCVWRPGDGSMPTPRFGIVDLLGYRTHVAWMPGPITIEVDVSASPGREWSALLIGRTVAEAKTVEAVAGPMVTVAPVRNGTFALSVPKDTRGNDPGPTTVRALAADGTLLGEWRQGQQACAVDPDGNVVFGTTSNPASCPRAVPWR